MIQWKITDSIGHLILTNPPQNQFSKEAYLALIDIVSHKIPGEAKAVIIYGEGRHFSSGADLPSLYSTIDEYHYHPSLSTIPEIFNKNIEVCNMLKSLPIPVVALINGVCMGAALELALFAHVRICTPQAILGLPESGFSLIPGCGGIVTLASLVGVRESMKAVLQAHVYGAKEACSIGLVDAVIEKKEALSNTISYISQLRVEYLPFTDKKLHYLPAIIDMKENKERG